MSVLARLVACCVVASFALAVAAPTSARPLQDWRPYAPDQGGAGAASAGEKVHLPNQIYDNGHLCGDPGLTGVPIQPIRGHLNGCGIPEPVQLSEIAGVALSRPINVDCPTARSLRVWIGGYVKPLLEPIGGGLSEVEVVQSFSCRTRNNIPGERISQHGRGKAIDISGFRLADGQVLSVLGGWRAQSTSWLMKRIHSSACGPFGTVLGPMADRYHQDHFHVDSHRRLSGNYCR